MKHLELIQSIRKHLLELIPESWNQAIIQADSENKKERYKITYVPKVKKRDSTKDCLVRLSPQLKKSLEELMHVSVEIIRTPQTKWKMVYYRNGKYRLEFGSNIERKSRMKRLDVGEVKKKIIEVLSIDLETADVDYLRKKLNDWSDGYSLTTPVFKAGLVLYRARVFKDEKPNYINQITYPSVQLIKTYQRANRPGQSLFYCSDSREASIFEVFPKPGNFIALSKWITNSYLLVNNVGYSESVFNALGSNRNSPKWEKDESVDHKRSANNLIRSFFAKEFTKIVPKGKEYLYKLSIVIAEKHFLSEMFGGLMYPTIAMRANAENFAIKSKYIEKHMLLKNVEYLHVKQNEKKSEYKVNIIDFANSFSQDGQIEWKGRKPHWEIKNKGEMLKLTAEKGEWVARNEKGKIVEPE